MPKTLGSLMDSREPAQDPSGPLEVEETGTYYNFKDLTPKRVKYIIQRADAHGDINMLYKLYDDMEVTDTRYSGIIGQLRKTVSGMPLRVIPAEGRSEKERELAEDYGNYARDVIEGLDTQSLTREFVEPYIRGASLFKLDWEQNELPYNRSMWFPESVERVDGRHFQQDVDASSDYYGELRVYTAQNNDLIKEPTPISEMPFDNHLFLEYGQGKGRYTRTGVARKVLPWWIALRFVQTWWVQYIESYGNPIRVGKYPAGASKKRRMQMKNFLQKVGRNGYGLFPHGMEVELMEASEQGQLTTYQDFMDKGHEEYSIHILGQAGTTGEGREGSYAQTAVLNGIRLDIIRDAGTLAAKGYKNLVKKGLRLNYGDDYREHLVPEVKPIILNDSNALERAKAVVRMSKLGADIPVNYLYEKILGVRKPQDGEMVIRAGETFEKGSDDAPEPIRPEENTMSGGSDSGGSSTGDRSVVNDSNTADQESDT